MPVVKEINSFLPSAKMYGDIRHLDISNIRNIEIMTRKSELTKNNRKETNRSENAKTQSEKAKTQMKKRQIEAKYKKSQSDIMTRVARPLI